jgi:succinate dehydrogenase/fumarate reductase flavoprotein subunit
MLLAARFMLEASLFRTESRLSHFRDDYQQRDDDNWLVWVDIAPGASRPELKRTPIPTPLYPVLPRAVRPTRLKERYAVAGS